MEQVTFCPVCLVELPSSCRRCPRCRARVPARHDEGLRSRVGRWLRRRAVWTAVVVLAAVAAVGAAVLRPRAEPTPARTASAPSPSSGEAATLSSRGSAVERAAPAAVPTTAPADPNAAVEGVGTLLRKVRGSVPTVRTFDADGKPLGLGSGFFVSPTDVISNFHVVRGSSRARLRFPGGEEADVELVVAEDRRADLVRLRVAAGAWKGEPLALSKTGAVQGERVVVVGSPLGLESSVSDGLVSGERELEGRGRMLQITAPISPGSSGGPVLSLSGDVVAVATLTFRRGQNVNFAVPASRIASLPQDDPVPFLEWARRRAEAASQREARTTAAIDARDFATALDELRAATEADPDDAVAWRLTGRCLRMAKDYATAISAYERALELAPDDARAWEGLARAKIGVRAWEEALRAASRSVELGGDLPGGHTVLGAVHLALQQHAKAAASLETATSIDPAFVEAWELLARAYGLLRRHDEAIAAYERAVALRPTSSALWVALADGYRSASRRPDAIRAYVEAAAQDDADPARLLEIAQNLRLWLGATAEAVTVLERLLQQAPGDRGAARDLATCLVRLRRFDEAVPVLRRALAQRSGDVELTLLLGDVYLEMGRLDDAERQLAAARALAPDDERAGSLRLRIDLARRRAK